MNNNEILNVYNTVKSLTAEPSKELLDKINLALKSASEIYYNDSDTVVSPLMDSEFDEMYRFYSKYRNDATTLTAVPKTKKVVNVDHIAPDMVGMTKKSTNIDEFEEWATDLFSKADSSGTRLMGFSVSQKYDGNSVVVVLDKDGNILQALTRGDDQGRGADVTEYFQDRKLNLPVTFEPLFTNTDDKLVIKTEAIVTEDNFEKLIEEKQFTNPRNAVSGLLSSPENLKFSKYISLRALAFKMVGKDAIDLPRPMQIKMMTDLTNVTDRDLDIEGFQTYEFAVDNAKTLTNAVNGIYKEYQGIVDEADIVWAAPKRNDLSYMIDGLVIEVVNEEDRAIFGRKNRINNFEIALKFPAQTARTTVKDIEWYISENGTGRITPVVVFEPVKFNGAVMTNVSLANYKRFKELSLAVGDEIIVEYRNDVLSYVNPSPTNKNVGTPIEMPDEIEGNPVYVNDNGTFAFIEDKTGLYSTTGTVNNFFEKIGIKGIKWNKLKSIFDNGLLKSPADIFDIKEEQLEALDDWGEISAKDFVDTVSSIKELSDMTFYGSIGIPGVGRTTMKNVFTSLTEDELIISKLEGIDGVSSINANKIVTYLETNKDWINDMKSHIKINSLKEEIQSKMSSNTDIPTGKTVVFTGIRSKEREEFLTTYGNKVTGSVSKKTDYLVTNDPTGTSSKLKKARDLGVEIIDLDKLDSIFSINI